MWVKLFFSLAALLPDFHLKPAGWDREADGFSKKA